MNPDTAFACLTFPQRQVLEAFGERGVRFIIIGGYAVRFYGMVQRQVHDLDVVVDCAADNLERLRAAVETVDAGHVAAWREKQVQTAVSANPDWTEAAAQDYRVQLQALYSQRLDGILERLRRDAHHQLTEGEKKVMPCTHETEMRASDLDHIYDDLIDEAIQVTIVDAAGFVVSKVHLIESKQKAIALGEHREAEKRAQDAIDLDYLQHLDD